MLYGATAYSQALVGLYPDTTFGELIFDDNSDYWGHRVYSRQQEIHIVKPDNQSLNSDDTVIICAYLHTEEIGSRLRNAGFKGKILTLGEPGYGNEKLGISSLFDAKQT